MVICFEHGAIDLHVVQLMPLPPIISYFVKIQYGSAFLLPAYPGCPGKEAVKRMLLHTYYGDFAAVTVPNVFLCVFVCS